MKYKMGFVLFVAFIIALTIYSCAHKRSVDSTASQAVLPPGAVNKVIVNPQAHTLTVLTPGHSETLFLPSRPSDIIVYEDGHTKIEVSEYGFEEQPFLGPGFGDGKGRVYLGLNQFYFKRADFFWALGLGTNYTVQPIIGIGYNFWSNTSINIGLNPVNSILEEKPEYGVFLSVKL